MLWRENGRILRKTGGRFVAGKYMLRRTIEPVQRAPSPVVSLRQALLRGFINRFPRYAALHNPGNSAGMRVLRACNMSSLSP